MSKKEIQLYLNRAKEDLMAVEINLQNGLYTVAISRSYYAMFYAASALLKSIGVERKKHPLYLSEKEHKATADFISRLADENIFPLSVVLFGSKARGDFDAESDIDLLLVLPAVSLDLRDHVRNIAADVSLDYSTYLSTRVWSEAYFEEQARIKTNLFQEVRRDGVELLPVAS